MFRMTPPTPYSDRRRRLWAIIALIVVMTFIALWRIGTFDRPLSAIGLNAHNCARNLAGATFCGEQLKEVQTQQSLEQSRERLAESSAITQQQVLQCMREGTGAADSAAICERRITREAAEEGP